MKKLTIVFIVLFQFCFSQDLVTIKHKNYTTTFSKSLHYPVVVKYWITNAMFRCKTPIARTNNFRPDPELPDETNLKKDYAASGYDQGHNMDANDNRCDAEAMSESFYYSNMCPQTPALNRGEWKMLESACRIKAIQYDSVLIWCGSVNVKSHKKIGRVSVPDYCWKIVYTKKLGTVEAFSYPNDNKKAKPIKNYQVPIDSVERMSGIKFSKQ